MQPIPDTCKKSKNLRTDRSWVQGKPTTIILLRDIAIKGLLMTYCYTHRSANCSAHIREASSGRRWELMKRPIAEQRAKSKILKPSVLNVTASSNPFLQGSGRGGTQIVRTRGKEGLQGNSVSQTHQGRCTSVLRVTVAAHKTCTRSSQTGPLYPCELFSLLWLFFGGGRGLAIGLLPVCFYFCFCVSMKGLFVFGVLCLFSREQREKEINLGGQGVREDLEEMTEWKYMIKIL